jgi:hypothetical protein
MRIRQGVTFLFAVIALLLGACAPGLSPEEQVQTSIAQTLQIAMLETAAAAGAQTSTPSVPLDTATITLTSTSAIPYVSVTTATNCRTGPGVAYGLVTTIQVGQQVEVVETFSSNYVVVRNPNGSGLCWLWLQYATQTNFSAYNLPQATQPPTPTITNTPLPSFNFQGEWNIWVDNGTNFYTGTANMTVSGNSITGTWILNPGNLNYNFSGTLTANGQVASGNFTGPSIPGTLQWQIKAGNLNQFIGNLTDANYVWSMCGARSGSSQPSPCKWP